MDIKSLNPSPVTRQRPGFTSYLAGGYWNIFGREWPPWLGGLLLGLTAFAFFAYGSPWFIYGGFLLSGSWLVSFVGIDPPMPLSAVWLNTGWVHDVAIIFGAFIAALVASNFRFRMPRRKIRLAEGFAGGLLMDWSHAGPRLKHRRIFHRRERTVS